MEQNRQHAVVLGAGWAGLVHAVPLARRFDRITLVDTRPVEEILGGTVPGALAIPAPDKAATYGGWAYDPESDTRPLVLLAPDQETAQGIWDHLVRVGVDDVTGYVTSFDGLPVEKPATVSPADLEGMEHVLLLDVRNRTEHTEGTIPGAEQLSAGKVLWHQDRLPQDGTIVTFCQSGVRNCVAASALRRAGFDVVELEGSYQGWLDEQARRATVAG